MHSPIHRSIPAENHQRTFQAVPVPAVGRLFHGIHLSLAGPAATGRRWSPCGSNAARGSAARPHRFIAQKVVPLVIPQVGGDDGGVATIALFHQLEEGVGLFGLEIQVAEFD
jgi:hypothetical protein